MKGFGIFQVPVWYGRSKKDIRKDVCRFAYQYLEYALHNS